MADYAESTWATVFQEQAETMLGINAEALGNLKSAVCFHIRQIKVKTKYNVKTIHISRMIQNMTNTFRNLSSKSLILN